MKYALLLILSLSALSAQALEQNNAFGDTVCRVYGSPDKNSKTFRGQIFVSDASQSQDHKSHIYVQMAKDAGTGNGIVAGETFATLDDRLKDIAPHVSRFKAIGLKKFQYNFAAHPAGSASKTAYVLDGNGCKLINAEIDDSNKPFAEQKFPWFRSEPVFAGVMDAFAIYYNDYYSSSKYASIKAEVTEILDGGK